MKCDDDGDCMERDDDDDHVKFDFVGSGHLAG